MALEPKEIYEKLHAAFPDISIEFDETVPCILVEPMKWKTVALFLRDADDLKFDSLMCLSGVDTADGNLVSVCHLDSMVHRHKLTVKCIVPAEEPKVESVERVWRTADWHEREAYDLIGIEYVGHRDLRRILMPYDWTGHPLRKDYEVPEFYNGIKVPY